MCTELEWEGVVELSPEYKMLVKHAKTAKEKREYIEEFAREHARNLDGGEFTPDDGFGSGSWDVHDTEAEVVRD